MKSPAFYFDSSACSGCKACQAACQDKNSLPTGVLWRRVYEVSGGGWERRGAAWISTVFAYNLSISCNHCQAPICLEVCPAGAYSRRPDGIVLLDSRRCIGCRCCVWACPYGAPQYNPDSGRTGKCDFCADLLDLGKPPACVAACPLRTLEFGERNELEAEFGPPAVYPLPDPSLTRPGLALRLHLAAARAESEAAAVANWEEVHSRPDR
jgi:anaerobic dimethyl sulfoxide reductase subunit B (iron-sulfur subunit)